MRFPEINTAELITHNTHMTKTLCNKDLIIGKEILHKLGIDIKYSTKTMCCNDV